jgi:hypothetical protein
MEETESGIVAMLGDGRAQHNMTAPAPVTLILPASFHCSSRSAVHHLSHSQHGFARYIGHTSCLMAFFDSLPRRESDVQQPPTITIDLAVSTDPCSVVLDCDS